MSRASSYASPNAWRGGKTPLASSCHRSPSQCHTSPDGRSMSEPPTSRVPSRGWTSACGVDEVCPARRRPAAARPACRPSHYPGVAQRRRQALVDHLVAAVEDHACRRGDPATVAAGQRIGLRAAPAEPGPARSRPRPRSRSGRRPPASLPPYRTLVPDVGSKVREADISAPGPRASNDVHARPSHSQVSSEAPDAVSPPKTTTTPRASSYVAEKKLRALGAGPDASTDGPGVAVPPPQRHRPVVRPPPRAVR